MRTDQANLLSQHVALNPQPLPPDSGIQHRFDAALGVTNPVAGRAALEQHALYSALNQNLTAFLPATAAGTDRNTPSAQARQTETGSLPDEARNTRAGAAGGDPVTGQFQRQFADKAANKGEFHQFMKTVYGNAYDPAEAEKLRQQALNGDYSWLPRVEYLSGEALGGANGAYDKQAGVVYLNEELRGTELAAQTFVEEAGHHIDTLVNDTDAAGDEGELMRRLLDGEQLSDKQLNEVRSENDKGTIEVDGREIEVEFWNPFKAIGDAVSSVAEGVVDAVKGVGNAIKTAAEGVVDATVGVVKNVGEGIWNFGSNLFQGNVVDAFGALGDGFLGAGRSLLNGLDQLIFQAPQTLYNGALSGVQGVFNGFTELVPGGQYLREVSDRVFDAGRSVMQAGFGIGRDLFRAPYELTMDFVEDLGESAGHLLRGEFTAAAEQFGMSFVNLGVGAGGRVTDVAVRALHSLADVVGMAVGQPPSRELSEEEQAYLQQIYGDSLDYSQIRVREGGITDAFGMAAHVVGNTVYMPAEYFNADGTLNDAGMETLGHEAGHVWQNQNGGGDYIHKALFAQLGAIISGGDRNGAYNWLEAMREGVAFEDMNPEQQASVAEDIGIALRDDGVVNKADFPALSDAEFAFLLDAWAMIRAGEGAP